jgi:integrase
MSNDLVPANPHLPDCSHPVDAYLAHLSPGSRNTMLKMLRWVASRADRDVYSFPWATLRFQQVAAIQSWLASTPNEDGKLRSAATVNLAMSALRGVLNAARKLGLISSDDCTNAIDVPAVKGSRLPRGRSLETGELRSLFDACREDETKAGRRDAAMLAVLYGSGIRRAEAFGLDLDDYKPDTGELRVRGKGNKERLCYATNGSKDALAAWLAVRGDEPGPLFLPVNKGGNVVPHRMTGPAIYKMLAKRAAEASIDSFSPHDLRRSFVSDMLENNADISMVQQLAGHASVTTTQRYDRRPEHAKRKAAELLHVPFGGWGKRTK